MNQLISVIVPVYNVEEFVKKCLDSLVRQSYKNLEIIVIDDGSTDNSGRICDEFAKKEKNIKVFHKKNGGLSDARNFGIKKAGGEIIAFVDSDDFVDEEYIGVMYGKMVQKDVDVVVCGYNFVKPKKDVLSGKNAAIKLLTKHENIDIVAWNKLYRKSLFADNEIWFPKGKKHEDTLTTYKVLSKARKVVYLDEALYFYNERPGSITKIEKIEERLTMRELAAEEAVSYFKKDSDLEQAAEVSLLLAKYAFLDRAIGGKIGKKYGEDASSWIKLNMMKYKNNKYMTKKLRMYNCLLSMGLYKAFRKIKNEK